MKADTLSIRLFAATLIILAITLTMCDETIINNYYDIELEFCDWEVNTDTIYIGECNDTSIRLICEHQAELFGANTLEVYDSVLECTYWVQEKVGIVNADFQGEEIGYRRWRYTAIEPSGVHTWQIEHEDDLLPLTINGVRFIEVDFKIGTTWIRLNHHFYNNCQSSRQITKTY